MKTQFSILLATASVLCFMQSGGCEAAAPPVADDQKQDKQAAGHAPRQTPGVETQTYDALQEEIRAAGLPISIHEVQQIPARHRVSGPDTISDSLSREAVNSPADLQALKGKKMKELSLETSDWGKAPQALFSSITVKILDLDSRSDLSVDQLRDLSHIQGLTTLGIRMGELPITGLCDLMRSSSSLSDVSISKVLYSKYVHDEKGLDAAFLKDLLTLLVEAKKTGVVIEMNGKDYSQIQKKAGTLEPVLREFEKEGVYKPSSIMI